MSPAHYTFKVQDRDLSQAKKQVKLKGLFLHHLFKKFDIWMDCVVLDL